MTAVISTHPHPHANGVGDGLTRPHTHTAGQEPTVLDIGADLGALVLHTSAPAEGEEIEISPAGRPEARQHVAVNPRHLGDRVVHAAVYPNLGEGDYDLWWPGGAAALRVSIVGGEITEATWPG